MSLDQRAFRNALGCFATGVTVATTRGEDGRPVGVTVNSFNSVSLDPPLVLFCLDRASQNFVTFSRCTSFAINVLREDQRDLSVRFSVPLGDRWQGVAHESWETGSPVLSGSLASLECDTIAVHDAGDHIMLIGRVRRLAFDRTGRPLLYFGGNYASLAGES